MYLTAHQIPQVEKGMNWTVYCPACSTPEGANHTSDHVILGEKYKLIFSYLGLVLAGLYIPFHLELQKYSQ